MKRIQHYVSNHRQGLKGVALLLFIVTPGSMLVLPLVAWWMVRKGNLLPNG